MIERRAARSRDPRTGRGGTYGEPWSMTVAGPKMEFQQPQQGQITVAHREDGV